MFTGTQSRLYAHGYTASLGVGTAAPTLGKLAVGAAGSAAAPALTFTAFEPNTGFYVTAAGKFGLAISGVLKYDYAITTGGTHTFQGSFNISNGNLQVGAANSIQWAGRVVTTSPAAATLQIGAADNSAPAGQTIQSVSVVAGNANTAGGTFTIAGAKSNGSGSSDVVFQTTNNNAASGTQNTLATALTLKGGTQAVVTSSGVGDTGYQYATPTTGQTVTLTGSNYHCIIDPAGTLAALTINMVATPFDGQMVDIKISQVVTALTVSGNGNSVKGNPTSAAVGSSFTGIYRAANTTWYF